MINLGQRRDDRTDSRVVSGTRVVRTRSKNLVPGAPKTRHEREATRAANGAKKLGPRARGRALRSARAGRVRARRRSRGKTQSGDARSKQRARVERPRVERCARAIYAPRVASLNLGFIGLPRRGRGTVRDHGSHQDNPRPRGQWDDRKVSPRTALVPSFRRPRYAHRPRSPPALASNSESTLRTHPTAPTSPPRQQIDQR